jgi:hypothetical protein
VLPEFVERCPVSGKPALRDEFAQCTQCRQRVSKAVMQEGLCAACRGLASVNKDDPRLQWIFAEHPGLDRWTHWQFAETADVYIATAARLLKRLLIVVEKETLVPRRLATAGRCSSKWIDVMDTEQAEILK